MQTVSQLMGIRAQAVEKTTETSEEKKDKTYFEKGLERIRSGDAQMDYDIAKTVAKHRTNAFVDSLRNVNHPDHLKNIAKYTGAYGNDLRKAAEDILHSTCAEMNSPDPEILKQNPQYEASIAEQYKPKGNISHEDIAFHDILLGNLKKSRDQRGYGEGKQFDKEVIDDWRLRYNRP